MNNNYPPYMPDRWRSLVAKGKPTPPLTSKEREAIIKIAADSAFRALEAARVELLNVMAKGPVPE